MALVGGVDVTGQPDPEHRYGHGVVIQDPVPPHPPEPATLNQKQAHSSWCLTLTKNMHSLHSSLFDSLLFWLQNHNFYCRRNSLLRDELRKETVHFQDWIHSLQWGKKSPKRIIWDIFHRSFKVSTFFRPTDSQENQHSSLSWYQDGCWLHSAPPIHQKSWK